MNTKIKWALVASVAAASMSLTAPLQAQQKSMTFSGSQGPVAQFMYHNAQGQRLTLYVTREAAGQGDTAFRFAQEGPVNVFYWIDGRFGYAISAGADRKELYTIAQEVYRQLTPTMLFAEVSCSAVEIKSCDSHHSGCVFAVSRQ